MDNTKVPIQAAIIGFCLSFIIYQVIFNLSGGGGILVWILAFVIPCLIAAVAFFVAQKIT